MVFLRSVTIASIASAGLTVCGPALAAALTLHPGLSMTTSVYDGRSSNGDRLGDYETVDTVTQVTPDGSYSYSYRFIAGDKSHGLAPNSGTQTVFAEDNKHANLIREFWPSGDQTAKGYLGAFRLSDDVFRGIKSGKDTKLEYDAGDSPHSVRKTGEEDLTILVNERPTRLHTLVVKSPVGTFWVLDNPGLSLVVKGETKWKWMVTALNDAGGEGGAVVAALKTSGEATTHAILFGFNSANVDVTAKPVLDSVAQYLKANPAVSLEVQGHTDSIGGGVSNLALSQSRAEAVKAALVADGVKAARLTAKGYGLTQPIADNGSPEGRARNRRVVFKQL
jgi:outer membrane protein OmpA-like peptidoglycan-associated protein